MRRRLLLTTLALVGAVLAVLVVPLAVLTARTEGRDLTAKVERDAHAVASLAEDGLEQGAAALPAVARVADGYAARTGGRVLVVDAQGTSVVDTGSEPGRSFASRPEIAAALRGDVSTGTRHSSSLGTDLLYVAVPVASGGVVHGAARVTYPTSEVDERVRRTWLVLAAVAAVALIVAVVLGLGIARWASRPLTRLEQAAGLAGAGDLSSRAPVEGPLEVQAVALAFNDTVARLEALVDAQGAFVADASHQLRTPLTALRLRLENVERDVAPDGRADLAAALAEVDRLAGLVDALLALARADADAEPAAPLDLGGAVRERLDAWGPLAVERGVRLTADLRPSPPVRAGRGRVEQVLDNLLANAVDVSPEGGAVMVTVAPVSGTSAVEMAVADEGPGLSAAERKRAFDRFWRGRGGEGSGLGLAIVRRLVEHDGGAVTLDEASGGGLRAVVRYGAAR